MSKRKLYIYSGIAIFFLVLFACFFNPYKFALDCVNTKHYKIASLTATIYQNLKDDKQKWYSINGYSKFHLKKYKSAIKDYDKAYLMATDDYGYMDFDNKIYIKYYTKDYDGALEDFDDEIQNTVGDGKANSFLWDKAQFLYNIKRYEDALDLYNKLIIKSQDDEIYLIKSRLYYERAQVLDKLGKIKQAKKDRDIADDLKIEETLKTPIPKPVLLLNKEF